MGAGDEQHQQRHRHSPGWQPLMAQPSQAEHGEDDVGREKKQDVLRLERPVFLRQKPDDVGNPRQARGDRQRPEQTVPERGKETGDREQRRDETEHEHGRREYRFDALTRIRLPVEAVAAGIAEEAHVAQAIP